MGTVNGQAGDMIEKWLTEHDVDWPSLKPHAKRRLMNKLQNCFVNIQRAHERAGFVIAEAKQISNE